MAASGSSSSASSNAGDSYIGSLISLISKYEIRYEGILYFLNTQDSTLGLKNVRSFGTEGRKKDGPLIPAGEKVYEYILFRGSDIKDLQVKFTPTLQSNEQMYNDPAIIQSGYATVSSPTPSASTSILTQSTQLMDTPALASKSYTHSGYAVAPFSLPSVGGGALRPIAQGQDTPALPGRGYPSVYPSYQSASRVIPLSQSQTTESTGGSLTSSTYWQGYNGMLMPTSLALQHSSSTVLPSLTMENQIRDQLVTSPVLGLANSSVSVTPTPSIASSPLYPSNLDFLQSRTPLQSLTSPDMPFPSSLMTSPPSYGAYMTPSGPLLQEKNTVETQVIGKGVYSSSSVDSTSGPLQTPPPPRSTPDQLAQVHSPLQNMYLDQKDAETLKPLSYGFSAPVTQASLLPLPVSAQQSQPLPLQFTEEFDFEAMNEKFKKDEVWDYLGRGKHRAQANGIEDNSTDQRLGKGEEGLLPNPDVKSAYQKDDFFDTISCNRQSRGSRNGHHRFTERQRMNTETFGNFRHRTHLGYYGGHAAGRGGNYRGQNNWDRGNGYGGRGHGGNMPF